MRNVRFCSSGGIGYHLWIHYPQIPYLQTPYPQIPYPHGSPASPGRDMGSEIPYPPQKERGTIDTPPLERTWHQKEHGTIDTTVAGDNNGNDTTVPDNSKETTEIFF